MIGHESCGCFIRAMVFSALAAQTAALPSPTAAATSESDSASSTRKGGAERSSESDTQLETVVITGSLLPPIQGDTAAPLTVITAEEMQSRGFPSLADALQQTTFATGSITGPQTQFGITPGLHTVSMFGLSPSYTKYLIDGRPIANYPALYGGSELVANLAGIPEEFIDRIEVVPGGQSSLYGSDAIAGTVNIILKKRLSGPKADFRYGAFRHGGGASKRLALADSFSIGGLDILAGAQIGRAEPIWGYQRTLTAGYYTAGTSPITAERDYVVMGNVAQGGPTYYFLDPSKCANASGQFGGSLRQYNRPDRGDYCGTTRSGFYTLDNSDRTVQGYLHATYALRDDMHLYADILATHDYAKFSDGTGSWSSYYTHGYYYDPNLNDLISLQRKFSPEEAGGLQATMSNLTSNAYRYRGGITGILPSTHWTFDFDASHAQYRLIRRTHVQFTQPFEQYFASILGPNLGPDPFFGFYPTFAPDYAAFFRPLTSQQYATFSGFTGSHANSSDNMVRAQLTQPSLVHLPAGDAGLALVLEYGNESWKYNPDPRLLDGEVYSYSAATGGGRRWRTAETGELRLPLTSTMNFDASVRYDNYHVLGGHVGKVTYSLALEYRPVGSLLIRGRYGTAFKAPSLADEFQGNSGLGASVTDYYQCALLGYSGPAIGNCPYAQEGIRLTVAGSPKLKPITAGVWSAGAVWRPLARTSVSVDFLHWDLSNEVQFQSPDQLMQLESGCRLGRYDINSPSCVAALSQVTRDRFGQLTAVFTPKVNVSREVTNAVTVQIEHGVPLGRLGTVALKGSWSDLLKHTYQTYPADPVVDVLRDPTFSTDFKSKVNASVTWSGTTWSSTIYAERTGRSPNSLAVANGYGTPGAGTLAPWTTCNLNVRYLWNDSVGLSLTLDNVFDRMPPADHTYTGFDNHPYNDSNYNVYGRAYYFEVTYAPRR